MSTVEAVASVINKGDVLSDAFVATVDYQSPEASKQFARALSESGFAIIINHPIASAKFDAFYAAWKGFYDSDNKINAKNIDPQQQDGFYPFRSENGKGYDAKNLMEYFHYYPWSQLTPENLQQITLQMHTEMAAVAGSLLKWLQSELKDEVKSQLSMPLDEMIVDSPRNLLRIIHYPPLTGAVEEQDAIRTSEHEDIDLLTVLPAATTRGLQVKDLEGNWHWVDAGPGALIINAGDMLQMCTKGFYKSTTHRVVKPDITKPEENVSRMSMPLFCHPRPEVKLSDEHTSESYLMERLRENGVL